MRGTDIQQNGMFSYVSLESRVRRITAACIKALLMKRSAA